MSDIEMVDRGVRARIEALANALRYGPVFAISDVYMERGPRPDLEIAEMIVADIRHLLQVVSHAERIINLEAKRSLLQINARPIVDPNKL